MNAKKYAAEAIGTFWLTFAGCGSAVIAAGFPQVGIGLVGVSFAFGLSVVTMAYAIGHVSGCHLNPAVTVGLAAGGRFPAGQILPYVIAQVVGAVHDHVRGPFELTEVEDVQDVGMTHTRDRLRLVPEPRHGILVRRERLHDLDRAGSLELRVIGAVDGAHGTLANELLDLVLAQPRSGLDRHGA